MTANPCDFTCEGCEFCAAAYEESADWREFLEGAGRPWAVNDDGPAAEYLTGLVEQFVATRYELELAVGMVKVGGWSWSRIAGVLSTASADVGAVEFGASKQAAAKRFGPAVEAATLTLEAAPVDAEAEAEVRRLARRLGLRAARPWYELRTAKRDGQVLSRHWSVVRAHKAQERHGGHVFRCDPRANVAAVLVEP